MRRLAFADSRDYGLVYVVSKRAKRRRVESPYGASCRATTESRDASRIILEYNKHLLPTAGCAEQ